MRAFIRHTWLLLLVLGIVGLTTGCATSALYESNVSYVKQNREFRRTGQCLPGRYLGTEERKGILNEVYQFESPFQNRHDGARLEVLVPIYGVSRKHPIKAYETRRLRTGGKEARLWFWVDRGLPDIPYVKGDSVRRIDICLTGNVLMIRRFIPGSTSVIAGNSEAELTIPWRRRSRAQYAARNVAYAATVPVDAVLAAGFAVGYCFVVDPCATIAIIQALN